MSETFVHGEIEVKKTGRVAIRPINVNKNQVLVEITPANDYDGTWKKWVNPDALFKILQQKESS